MDLKIYGSIANELRDAIYAMNRADSMMIDVMANGDTEKSIS